MNPTPWTDKATEEAARLWNDGFSAGYIAQQMGKPFTRNSIIGKATRTTDLFTPRPKGFTPTRRLAPWMVSQTAPKPKPKPKPIPAKGPIASIFGAHYIAPPKDTRPLRERAWEPLEGSSPVLIEDHTSGCVWPIGGAPFKYCNLERHDKRYCTQHAEMSRSKA